MNIADGSGNEPNALRCARVLLDEATQVLLRAESIVALLGAQYDGSAHHAYAANVAYGLLMAAKEKLSQARQLVQRCAARSAPKGSS